jgi:hypothetical protein
MAQYIQREHRRDQVGDKSNPQAERLGLCGYQPNTRKPMKLTVKQEAFCLAYMETGNASEAYRRAYNAGKMKPESIWVNAGQLLENTKVALRVAELQAKAAERSAITVDDLITELEEARIMAATGEKSQPSAMVAATMGKAKLLGFDVQKVDATINANTYSFEVRRAGSEL